MPNFVRSLSRSPKLPKVPEKDQVYSGSITISIIHMDTFSSPFYGQIIMGGVIWKVIVKPELKFCKSKSPTAMFPLYGVICMSVMVNCTPKLEEDEILPDNWIVPAKITLVACSQKKNVSNYKETFNYDFNAINHTMGDPFFMEKPDMLANFVSDCGYNIFCLDVQIEAEDLTVHTEMKQTQVEMGGFDLNNITKKP